MARLEDLPIAEQTQLRNLPCPDFHHQPWVAPKPLSERRVAIVNTAGLIHRGDRPLTPRDPRYRTFPHDTADEDILMSHVSVNFDRTAFQQDLNSVLPREPLSGLAQAGIIGEAAPTHYSFMGATEPEKMESHARRLTGELRDQGVDTVLLIPV